MAQGMGDYLEFLNEQVKDYQGDYQDIIATVPGYFALLTGVLDDSRFPAELRSVVNSALAYFISPFDFGEDEAVGAEGYVDDVYVCSLAVLKLRDALDDHAVILDHWDGEEDPFLLSQRIIEALTEELGDDSIQLIRQYTGLEEV